MGIDPVTSELANLHCNQGVLKIFAFAIGYTIYRVNKVYQWNASKIQDYASNYEKWEG